MCLSFIDQMDDLVKPHMKDSWNVMKPKIFVIDENDPFDLRYPGKWKREFHTSNGSIIM